MNEGRVPISREAERYANEWSLIYPIWLPTDRYLDLKIEGARMASLAVEEPLYVFRIDGGYWYGTKRQLDKEIREGGTPEIILTYLDGEPVHGMVAHQTPVREQDGTMGRGERA